jgi:PleD family two-component response regulator
VRTGGGRGGVEIAQRVISRAAEPVVVDRDGSTIEARVGASVGVAFADPGVTVGELVRRADNAVYRAKASGRGQVVVWTPDPR